jgi:hypothetical protein
MRPEAGHAALSAARALAVAGLALALARPAAAHDRTTSYSLWRLRGRVAEVTVRLAEIDLARAGLALGEQAASAPLVRYVQGRLVLQAGEMACAPVADAQVVRGTDGFVAIRYEVTCATTSSLSIRSDLLLDVLPTHLHFVRLDGDRAVSEYVLGANDAVWRLPKGSLSGATTVRDYVVFGFGRFLSAYDQSVFLLALLLVAGSLRSTATVVTAFVLAQSLTLALSVNDFVRPAAAPLDALVGLSIVLVSIENVWALEAKASLLPRLVVASLLVLGAHALRTTGGVTAPVFVGLALFSACYYPLARVAADPKILRWLVAFVFGLIHGFALATVVRDAGNPTARLPTGLLGFHLGVTLGQVVLIVASWPLLRALLARFGSTVTAVASALTLGVGVYWFGGNAFR